MDKTPLVSIIIPVYNAEQYLPFCLDSVKNQSWSNLQIILIDDGSTDSSPQICDLYASTDNRIIVRHQENGGIAKAQNAGLDLAKGDYIAFIDNDDIMARDNIEILFHALVSNHADMSKARWQQFGISQIQEIKTKASNGTALTGKTTSFNNPLQSYQTVFSKLFRVLGKMAGKNTEARYFNEANWCRLYARKVWDEVRFPEGIYAQDTAIAGELYLRMETVVDVDATLYYWLQRPDSVTHKMRSASFYHDHIVAAKKNFILCQENGVIPARSYYTLTGNLKDEGKAAKSSTEKQQFRIDQLQVSNLIKSLSLKDRMICNSLKRMRLIEKRIYDAKIKNMK